MTLEANDFQAAISLIEKSGRCGIVSHTNPDADALGSSLALAEILRDNKIACHVINESEITDRYLFLKGAKDIQKNFGDFQPSCLIAVDCADEKRVGDTLWPLISDIRPRLAIDHHRSHIKFGDVTLLDSEECSTAAMILDLAKFAKWKISKAAATALYAGIISDTGSFRYSAVTAKTFKDAAWLVENGVKPDEVAEALFSRVRREAALLQAEAFAKAEFLFGGKCVIASIDAASLVKHQATPEDCEGLAERGRDIEGVDVSIVAREVEGLWKVSMRATRTNVSKIAAIFGGGGHMYAAAFRSREPLSAFKPKLLAEVERALAPCLS